MVVGGEFASLEEPTEDVDVTAGTEFTTDGPEQIGFERWRVPRDPTRKLIIPIVTSIPRSRLSKAGRRVGGCGRKSMEPKRICPPMIIDQVVA
jgi:hypothetical protein